MRTTLEKLGTEIVEPRYHTVPSGLAGGIGNEVHGARR
jgi:hypothetical protein